MSGFKVSGSILKCSQSVPPSRGLSSCPSNSPLFWACLLFPHHYGPKLPPAGLLHLHLSSQGHCHPPHCRPTLQGPPGPHTLRLTLTEQMSTFPKDILAWKPHGTVVAALVSRAGIGRGKVWHSGSGLCLPRSRIHTQTVGLGSSFSLSQQEADSSVQLLVPRQEPWQGCPALHTGSVAYLVHLSQQTEAGSA